MKRPQPLGTAEHQFRKNPPSLWRVKAESEEKEPGFCKI